MQFQIPQFIDVEDKIAGPFTLKQLIYIVVGGVVVAIAFSTLPFAPAIFLSLIVAVICAVMVSKYQGQQTSKIVFAALIYLWSPRLYLWRREVEENIIDIGEVKEQEETVKEKRKTLQEFSVNAPLVKKLWSDLTTSKNPIPKREKKIADPIITLNVFRNITGEKEVGKRVDYR